MVILEVVVLTAVILEVMVLEVLVLQAMVLQEWKADSGGIRVDQGLPINKECLSDRAKAVKPDQVNCLGGKNWTNPSSFPDVWNLKSSNTA